MEYLIGFLLALAVGGCASAAGFDRDRSFYPVVVIVVATYYCLFAMIGGSTSALWTEVVVATAFTAVAVIGFRTTSWLVVAALAAHGVMDLVHHRMIANPGVPAWWPGFCSSFDITAAAYLSLCILMAQHFSAAEPKARLSNLLQHRPLIGLTGLALVTAAMTASTLLASGAAYRNDV